MATLDDLLQRELEIENAKAQLFSQIDELNGSLARVRVRMAEIRDVNRNAITNNLPDETLSAIFEAGLALTQTPYVVSWNPTWRKWEKPFEILVSSVSRRWRNVALDTPQLWTDLRINVSKFSAGDMLDLYLLRSKVCLLDIAFTQLDKDERSYNPDPEFDSKNFGWCLRQLVQHVARWRQFVVETICIGPEFTAFSPLANLCAPALERMVIDCPCSAIVMAVFSLGAPRLSYMELMGLYFILPPGTVTSVTLETRQASLSYADFSRLMVHTQSLTHLSLDASIVADFATSTHHRPPIELPYVLSLNLNLNVSKTGYPSLGALYFLDLPALESLAIQGTTADITKVFARHRRSYFALRSLKLTWHRVPNHEDIASSTSEFIRLFPNVCDLAFDGTHPAPILRALCEAQTTDDLLWPQLSVITLLSNRQESYRQNELAFEDVIDVAVNRITLGCPISRVTLSSRIVHSVRPRQQDRLQQRLRGLVELEVRDVE